MAYLNCPNCGFSVVLRHPLATLENCPRCARRGEQIELFVSATLRNRETHAAPSVGAYKAVDQTASQS